MIASDIAIFKQKALHWADKFNVCCLLDSNNFSDQYSRFDFLLAAGAKKELHIHSDVAFEELKKFHIDNPEWVLGMLSYDLKNEIEDLHSSKQDTLQFPKLFFFVPEYLLMIKNEEITVLLGSSDILEHISNTEILSATIAKDVTVQSRINKDTYLSNVKQIQQHIARGDVYELNYCQEFYAEQAKLNAPFLFHKLNTISPNPFAAYLKMYDQYILSASPERFLCKRGQQIISQPIKGTARRSEDATEDQLRKKTLKNNTKEQTENVMIVDLVRNDLTKNAVPGTVQVDELFGIYSFPHVHQMISTISCQLRDEVHPIDAIRNIFPMGSMTGAPKVRAMQLIDTFEYCQRGAYSGAVGYIDPKGDFDFNVVIRTLLYNATKAYLSFQVGGAITYASDPEQEYEECLLKASGILQTLQNEKASV